MRRHELTDEQWALIEPLLPPQRGNGRPFRDPPHGLQRLVLDPQHRLAVAGPTRAVRAVEDRVQPLQPLAEGGPDRQDARGVAGPPRRGRPHRLGPVVRRWQLGSGASVCGRGGQKRGPQEPADHALGRSRGGWGTKIHVVTDGHGTPLSVHVTPGQAHESAAFEAAVTALRIGGRRRKPGRIAGDKGYDIPRVREYLRRRRIGAVIPEKRKPPRPQTGSAAGLRPRRLPSPQRGRADHRLLEARPPDRHAVRKDRGQLPGDAQAGDDSALLQTPLTGRDLVPRRGGLALPRPSSRETSCRGSTQCRSRPRQGEPCPTTSSP